MIAPRPGRIAAAVFAPPLATYLSGGASRNFWITIGLTMLGFVPGMAHALWLVASGRGSAAPV
ncbi:YqaE/Pmp3 family membrane protein [Sphingomonas sp. HF-S3]|uniref:YqaE/Pmp3 family membrane protein n=1 Tax=Sphingomonas rustica TaxID=3103142 RepID=A0ABV0B4T6_9SPHN